jgi:hypothetical protein
LRGYQVSLRLFVEFVCDARYGWPAVCLRRFGQAPTAVLHEWNSMVHAAEFEGRPGRRPLTYDEVQTLFDAADGRVEAIRRRRSKGATAALRDAAILKTVYANGCVVARSAASTWPTCGTSRRCRTSTASAGCSSAGARHPGAAHRSGAPF